MFMTTRENNIMQLGNTWKWN